MAKLLQTFTGDVTRGDAAAAVRAFAGEPAFQWYSAGANPEGEKQVPRDRITAIYERRRLPAYLQSRVDAGEQLNLQEIQVAYDPRPDRADFELVGTRRAEDLRVSTDQMTGKGAIDCRTGKIMVLSLAMSYADHSPCPSASSASQRITVACRR